MPKTTSSLPCETSRFRCHPVFLPSLLSPRQQWQTAYGLNDSLPPSSISLPRNVPIPPHLHDCASLSRLRKRLESRGTNGEPPAWTKGSDGCPPQPPWVSVCNTTLCILITTSLKFKLAVHWFINISTVFASASVLANLPSCSVKCQPG